MISYISNQLIRTKILKLPIPTDIDEREEWIKKGKKGKEFLKTEKQKGKVKTENTINTH